MGGYVFSDTLIPSPPAPLSEGEGMSGSKKESVQHQIGLYIVDYFCDELKLILELDGSIHHTNEQIEKDKL